MAGDAVLADGTRIEDLIDRERRTLLARVHSDPEIFGLELERIFARAWIPVAHVSELVEPGDFVTRWIGRDPVIVTVDADGVPQVLLNICTHRGSPVCRAEQGNTRAHTCPFHGWAFGVDGALKGVPFERMIYGDGLDKASLGLRRARADVAAGIVFACWDDAAPDLDAFLGDFRFYLEAVLARTDGGLEVAGPPQRSVIEANWKVVADGFFGDAYHVTTVHNRSFADLGLMAEGDAVQGMFKATANGHSILCPDLEARGLTGDPRQVLTLAVPTGLSPDLVDQVERNLSPEQVALLATTPPMIGALFPSTAILMILASPAGQTASLRFFVPLAPTRTELLCFYLVERDAPAELKERIHTSSIGTFGVAGLFESDDVEVWAGVQRHIGGVIGRRTVANYQAAGTPLDPDPVRPGTTFRQTSTDDNQWRLWERYIEYLATP